MYAIEKIASDIETKTDLRKRVVNINSSCMVKGSWCSRAGGNPAMLSALHPPG
jgi:hypothetical protein